MCSSMIYSVSYDLNKEGQKYREVIDELKGSDSWARPTESQFLISTRETPKQVYERVAPHLDSNDEIFIIEVTGNYYGVLSQTVWDWIRRYLG